MRLQPDLRKTEARERPIPPEAPVWREREGGSSVRKEKGEGKKGTDDEDCLTGEGKTSHLEEEVVLSGKHSSLCLCGEVSERNVRIEGRETER
jgi:hypothetical protein